ncbi:MAG TPA: zf-HC2 domain-containing protein [Myxococcales bacterium]|nr:zf-HC2 domain-containing protein [Myxococcales bacterium]
MNATFDLGGPGPRCSIAQVRRLLGGELASPERERLEEHVKGCARCQASEREIQGERGQLAAAVPFPAFAAGVAERLAGAASTPLKDARKPGRLLSSVLAASWRYTSVSLAASLLLAGGWLVWEYRSDVQRQEMFAGSVDRLAGRTRVKGGADATLYVKDSQGDRALGPGEKVPAGAKILVSLEPAGHRFAAVALVDQDGVSPLYVGPAAQGPLPQAFLWTGTGTARVIIDYADLPIARDRFVRRLEAQGRPPDGTERVELGLAR